MVPLLTLSVLRSSLVVSIRPPLAMVPLSPLAEEGSFAIGDKKVSVLGIGSMGCEAAYRAYEVAVLGCAEVVVALFQPFVLLQDMAKVVVDTVAGHFQ